MMALLHGTVGIQHASMAIYNAYCDHVPKAGEPAMIDVVSQPR